MTSARTAISANHIPAGPRRPCHFAAGIATIAFALNHLGLTIPPQADCGWIGEAGPGPSYGDERDDGSRVGFDNDFTVRNTTIMTWNLMHLARMLKDAGGYPNEGNDRNAWKAGTRFGFENPEYRA